MRLLIALAFICVCSAATIEQPQEPKQEVSKEWTKPAFCNGLDCPEFEVLSKTNDYEYRAYKKSTWVKTKADAMDIDNIRSLMFNRLFQYISGNNEGSSKIAMTAPVFTRINPGQGPACESYFTMAFFVADDVADSAPKPKDSEVFLETHAPLRLYSRSYSGFATTELNLKHVAELEASLPKDVKVIKSYFFTAGYDSPFKPFDRHNEVWLVEAPKEA